MDPAPAYEEFRPPPALRDAVECLWVRRPNGSGDVRIVPDGCTDLVWIKGRGTLVAGPDTGPKVIRTGTAPGNLTVGMRLKPGAGGAVFGIPLDELCDERRDAIEVGPAFDIDAEATASEVLATFARLAAGHRADPLIAAATRQLGHRRIRTLARELGISERQLRRRFHSAVGYGPKQLARILRFRTIVDAIDRGAADLARLAFEAGYADQAHLTRETKRLSGLPPTALLAERTRTYS